MKKWTVHGKERKLSWMPGNSVHGPQLTELSTVSRVFGQKCRCIINCPRFVHGKQCPPLAESTVIAQWRCQRWTTCWARKLSAKFLVRYWPAGNLSVSLFCLNLFLPGVEAFSSLPNNPHPHPSRFQNLARVCQFSVYQISRGHSCGNASRVEPRALHV